MHKNISMRLTLFTIIFLGIFTHASFGAELIKPTRRAFLFGTGAIAAALVIPKNPLSVKQPLNVFEFVPPGPVRSIYSSSLTAEEELSIFRHVTGHNQLDAQRIITALARSRHLYQGGYAAQEVLVDETLTSQRNWQPVKVYDLNTIGRWINGFARFLSRKTFEQVLSSPAIEHSKDQSEALANLQQIEFQQNPELRCDPLLTEVPQGEVLIIEDDK